MEHNSSVRQFMNDFTLPENLDDWPRDPFALFRVTPNVSQSDLRRIYTRLIRLYKPERAPDQFRRIREAYETLQKYAAWNEMRADGLDVDPVLPPILKPTPAAKEIPFQPPGPGPEQLLVPEETPVHKPPLETEEHCWRWALAGEMERAYKALLGLRERKPENAGLYLRLYWLLIAMPELDAVCSPCDWLVRGLGSCSTYAGLLELYTEELIDHPEEAFDNRFAKLLEQARGPLLLELLERRWQTLARLERWERAGADLDAFSDRVCRDDEVAWLRLLLSLASKSFRLHRSVRKGGTNAVFRACLDHIKQLEHLGLAHGSLFDRVDTLTQMAYESTSVLPPSVLDFMGHFVAGRMDDAAATAEAFLAIICGKPLEGLRMLDQTAAEAPAIFRELCRALDWLNWSVVHLEAPTHSAAAIDRLVQRLLGSVLENALNPNARRGKWINLTLRIESPIHQPVYPRVRKHILHYCCEEALSPEQICTILEAPAYGPNYLGQMIAADLPLRWTYQAFRLGQAL